jgi:hypothetical protein
LFAKNKHTKKANMDERVIIEKALERLQEQTGIAATWRPAPPRHETDGEVELTYNKEPRVIPVEIKTEIRANQLEKLIRQKTQFGQLLVVAEYIYPKLKQTLREDGFAYLETNGNVYMKEKDLYLWIDNEPTEPKERTVTGRAFGKTGLKLLFHLLNDETLLNQPYRQIAEQTGVVFGNINFILTDLKEQDFLLPITKNTWTFTRRQELLQKWVRAYNEKLKAALELGAFRFAGKNDYFNWQGIAMEPGHTVWGGEPAGAILTDQLHPQHYTLYTDEPRAEWMLRYKLLPDKKGDVTVYNKFWKRLDTNPDTVPPLLAYADLIATGDRRCLQTAQLIYDVYLQPNLRPD